MIKKVWTASDMGRKGIRKMLEKFDPDPVKAREKIARKKKRQGANLGGRPFLYPACTFRFPSTGKLRGCHRFKNGVCDCGVKQK
jgi:hypothetical protein